MGICESKDYETVLDIMREFPTADAYLIDMAIGLPECIEESEKRPDKATREELGKNGSTVFPIPCRQAVMVDPNDPYLTTGHESYACLFLSDNAIRPIYNNGLRRTWDENIVPDEGKIGFYSTASGIGYFMGRRYAGEWLENNGTILRRTDLRRPTASMRLKESATSLFPGRRFVRAGSVWRRMAGMPCFSGSRTGTS